MNNYYNPYYPAARNECCRETETSSACRSHGVTTPFPEDYAPAMAYVPFQLSNETYDCEKALCQGTLFPALDKPFVGCCS